MNVDKYGVSGNISLVSSKEPINSNLDTYAVSSTTIGFIKSYTTEETTEEKYND